MDIILQSLSYICRINASLYLRCPSLFIFFDCLCVHRQLLVSISRNLIPLLSFLNKHFIRFQGDFSQVNFLIQFIVFVFFFFYQATGLRFLKFYTVLFHLKYPHDIREKGNFCLFGEHYIFLYQTVMVFFDTVKMGCSAFV